MFLAEFDTIANMNTVPGDPQPNALRATPLANRADFLLGNVIVRPSLRTVEGPLGHKKGEPRVIQVLVALADARGRVLSRDELLSRCWEGRIVGDDAIHRAIAEVRRIVQGVGADFEVETVPRIGYRISGVDWDDEPATAPEQRGSSLASRRNLMIGGAAFVAALAGGGVALRSRQNQAEVSALIDRGRTLQATGGRTENRQAERLFTEALERDPTRADAWGWLAVVLQDDGRAREAAHRAIQIDPREPNARTVLAYQRRDLDSWTRWEDTLLAVLADAPDCAPALAHLTLFYQGMGRCRDSWSANERAIRIEPFAPSHHGRRALKHWIFGRVGDADKVADQGLQLWPRHSSLWNARMLIYAATDRAPAALALLDDVQSRPTDLTRPSVDSWRAALTAIGTRAPADLARMLETCSAAARLAPGLAANAIMFFSHLGELGPAYRVAEGLFEGRGTLVQTSRSGGIRDIYSGATWGRTQFLFIPVTARFRADPRFPDLCRRLGHVAYWQARGIWPDPFVRGSLDPARLA